MTDYPPEGTAIKDGDLGYRLVGPISDKVIKNQKLGVTDIRDDPDRKGGATRTDRNGKN